MPGKILYDGKNFKVKINISGVCPDKPRNSLNLKTKEIQKDAEKFDMMATQKLKEQRIIYENLKSDLDKNLKSNNWKKINSTVDDFTDLFKVEIPYKSSKEFVELLKKQETVKIGA